MCNCSVLKMTKVYFQGTCCLILVENSFSEYLNCTTDGRHCTGLADMVIFIFDFERYVPAESCCPGNSKVISILLDRAKEAKLLHEMLHISDYV